ncbi:TauD/TfdA family dioxygenase [Coleofasciculus sp. H7-2]|uniref:TauD/TfdA family dioxygenase n=1 Tax=Coleofasciculus sp. H7-2 TaxID=3351545 RepID=UPI00367051F8
MKNNKEYFNPVDLLIRISSFSTLSQIDILGVFDKLNHFGCVILELSSYKNLDDLLYLQNLFGSIAYHPHSETNGIVHVTPNPNQPEYINTTNLEITPHSDGAFELEPPRFVALHCETPAEKGGFSTLVSSQKVYDYLAQESYEGLLTLFDDDAFSIRRDNKQLTRPVFQCRNKKIHMSFRRDQSVNIFVKHQAQRAFDLTNEFLINPKNWVIFTLEPDQILILDNSRILHGRTAFTGDRKLNRLWFNGNSNYKEQYSLGFLPCTQVGKDIFEIVKTKHYNLLEKEAILKDYRYWSWMLRYCHGDYLGACIFKLKRENIGSVATLLDEELMELRNIISQYESITYRLFQPDRFNYFQLGNEYHQLHIHAVPRYKEKRNFCEADFIDKRWGAYPFPIENEISLDLIKKIRSLYKSLIF